MKWRLVRHLPAVKRSEAIKVAPVLRGCEQTDSRRAGRFRRGWQPPTGLLYSSSFTGCALNGLAFAPPIFTGCALNGLAFAPLIPNIVAGLFWYRERSPGSTGDLRQKAGRISEPDPCPSGRRTGAGTRDRVPQRASHRKFPNRSCTTTDIERDVPADRSHEASA